MNSERRRIFAFSGVLKPEPGGPPPGALLGFALTLAATNGPVRRVCLIPTAVGDWQEAIDHFADLFAGRDEVRKLDILRRHCEAVGRDYDTIYKTAYYVFDPSRGAQRIVDELGALAEAGFAAAIGPVASVWDIRPLEIIGSEVIPRAADF